MGGGGGLCDYDLCLRVSVSARAHALDMQHGMHVFATRDTKARSQNVTAALEKQHKHRSKLSPVSLVPLQ